MWHRVVLTYLVIITTSGHYAAKRVVCYYKSDNVYRSEGYRMQPDEIDPHLCTHVIYYSAFIHPEQAVVPSDSFIDITKGGYKKVVKLKERNPELKVMLSLQNDPNDRDLWPLIASEREIRHWFSLLVIRYLRTYNFDGLDIIWHVPSNKMTSHKYLYLLKDLRQEIELESQQHGLPKLEISVFLPAQIQQLHRHFLLSNASTYVDFINVASMDYWILDPYTVQHHAPLFMNKTEGSVSSINVDESIKYYLYKCVNPEKIVLGIPTYGRSFKLTSRHRYNMGSSCTYPGMKGFATNIPGSLAYFEICTYIKEENWPVDNVNLTSMGPYSYSGDRWVGFDDVAIVSKKAKYARNQGLGGLMFWTIDQDDFRGYCDYRYPLIKAGKFTFTTGIEVMDQDMLEYEENRWSMAQQGYHYPIPTIRQPEFHWHEISTTPMSHLSTTNIPIATTESHRKSTVVTMIPVNPDIIPLNIGDQRPVSSSTTEKAIFEPITTREPTTSRRPMTTSTRPTVSTENRNLPTTSPSSPLFSTENPLSSSPEEDNDSAKNAINQLNKVLDTVNQVVSNLNEVNSASRVQDPRQNNVTIDPSFLQILQPLFNLRNRAEYSVDMSQPGRPANSTVTVDSDLNKYNVNNGNVKSLIGIPLNQLIPSLTNSNVTVNITGSKNFSPFDMLKEKNLIISGRDVVSINLNITINNNYFGNN